MGPHGAKILNGLLILANGSAKKSSMQSRMRMDFDFPLTLDSIVNPK
jgi:hypothetical protein